MDKKEWKKMKMGALESLLETKRLELVEKRMKVASNNKEGKVRELRVFKRDIARINTIINEKKRHGIKGE